VEVLDGRQTASRLPYTELADSIQRVALARHEEGVRAPARIALPLPEGGVLLIMPATDGETAITKLVTVHPENAALGLPAIQGEVVVMEARTGERLGILDGAAVTARRTAALSLLAARTLAPHPGGSLLIVGAGAQARSHLEAFREGLGVSRVFIASRTTARSKSLAGHAKSLGMDAEIIRNPEGALDRVSLVVTATTSREPVLPDNVPDGIFITAIGAFNPEMAELPPALISRSTVVVDTLEGAMEEAGDLIQAARAGAFRWENAIPLEAVLRESTELGGPVVFKSVGHALWDLAAARTAFLR